MKNLLCSRGRKAKGGGDEDVFQPLISLDVSDCKYTSIRPRMDGWRDGGRDGGMDGLDALDGWRDGWR